MLKEHLSSFSIFQIAFQKLFFLRVMVLFGNVKLDEH